MTYPASLSNAAGVLGIVWTDGTRQHLANARLRRHCRCADCKALRLQTGAALDVASQTTITEIRMVGHYAAQLIFSDGHERGIYPWVFLKAFDAEESVA
jgi:DUF971 family protein